MEFWQSLFGREADSRQALAPMHHNAPHISDMSTIPINSNALRRTTCNRSYQFRADKCRRSTVCLSAVWHTCSEHNSIFALFAGKWARTCVYICRLRCHTYSAKCACPCSRIVSSDSQVVRIVPKTEHSFAIKIPWWFALPRTISEISWRSNSAPFWKYETLANAWGSHWTFRWVDCCLVFVCVCARKSEKLCELYRTWHS